MKSSILAHPPTARAFRRVHRLGPLTDTPVDRPCRAAVAAVASGRRHVRFPRRARAFPVLAEAPRRSPELILTGVASRP